MSDDTTAGEPAFIPDFDGPTSSNSAGDVHGVQAGVVNGDVTIGGQAPDLIVRRATTHEIDEVHQRFVPPGGLAAATALLREHGVVILHGRGTGRSYTARRLLCDAGASGVVHLNPERSLGTVRADKVEPDRGYIWDVRASGSAPFDDIEFDHGVRVLRGRSSLLVILLDRRSQAPSRAAALTVELTAPPALDVALAVLGGSAAPSLLIKTEFAPDLEAGAPPEQAVRAAHLAVRVAEGELDLTDALHDLRAGVEQAVDRWFTNRSVLDYAMAVAVAVLEHEPFDEVMRLADTLDQNIRRAELPEDKHLRPRRVFTVAKEKLLADIHATVDLRDHPTHTGLTEETVRFERQGWAAAVLRHTWREYPTVHAVLQEWLWASEMLARFPDATRRALCAITVDIPAHEPLRLVNHLASSVIFRRNQVAATALAQLADDHSLLPLVTESLEHWAEKGTGSQLGTVALFQATPYGRQDIDAALRALERIGRSPKSRAQNAVCAATLTLIVDDYHRERVMDAIVSWSRPRSHWGGLRDVSMTLTLRITGLHPHEDFDPGELTDAFPTQTKALVARLLTDSRHGLLALAHLADLADRAWWNRAAARELLRLMTLISPDLGWRSRRRVIARFGHTRGTRATITKVFRAARRAKARTTASADVHTVRPDPDQAATAANGAVLVGRVGLEPTAKGL